MAQIAFGAAIVATASFMIRLEANSKREVAFKQFQQEQKAQLLESSISKALYDFIIDKMLWVVSVGGGTAGCLLAGKLSQHFEVLLLEAGGPAPSLTSIPAFREFLDGNDLQKIHWSYDSVLQKKLNRTLPRKTAKMLGGSFSHNSLKFNRGNSRDYDNWAKLTNDPTWKYKHVLEIFKDLEKYMGPFPSDERGTKGPFPIFTLNRSDLVNYQGAAKELGYTYGDANGPQKKNQISPTDFTQSRQRAVTNCSIFVEPFIGIRKSLKVLKYSEARKILFLQKTAKGVRYKRFGKRFVAFARKEVIISAGTFGSLLLLFKSGIGPKRMLRKAGIRVKADLSVGKILQEHEVVTINFTRPGIYALAQNLTSDSIESYLKDEESDLAKVISGPQLLIVSSIAISNGEGNWPDILIRREIGILDSDGKAYTKAGPVIARPMSSGSLKLNSTAYKLGERRNTRLAIIDYNIFGSENDVAKFYEGAEVTVKLYTTKAIKALGVYITPSEICLKESAVNSKGYWDCLLREYGTTENHPTGTCRMGRDTPSTVDSKFRVIGLRRLRIIDASVMPAITNADTNAATLLIAEKGVRTLLKTYKIRK